MAKKHKKNGLYLPTLHTHVPHWVSYAVLILLFIVAVQFVAKMTGYNDVLMMGGY